MPFQISQHHYHWLPATPKFTEQKNISDSAICITIKIFLHIPTSGINISNQLENVLAFYNHKTHTLSAIKT